MTDFRPIDLAREHGISAQAVRNYENEGMLPAADRTGSGYRVYTDRHVRALRTFLALLPGFGHAASRQIMIAAHRGDIGAALAVIDDCHQQLREDRATLRSVVRAVSGADSAPRVGNRGNRPAASERIGDLAGRLGITAATLRTWERAGILAPTRDRTTGYRDYGEADLRDASLAHLLRRGGYPLDAIARIVAQIRGDGASEGLAGTIDDWQRRLTSRGLQMLESSGALSEYLHSLGAAD